MMQHEPILCIIISTVYFLTLLPGFHLGNYGVGDFLLSPKRVLPLQYYLT